MIVDKITAAAENFVSQHQINFVCPFLLETIHSIELVRSVNEHALLTVTGILKEDKVQQHLYEADHEEVLTLTQIGGKTLFKGYLKSVKIKHEQGLHYITIEGVSATYMMDIMPQYRSFQNIKEKYVDAVKEVIEKYDRSDFIDTIADETAIGELRIQYMETDWQFLKRMASYLGGVLAADVSDCLPRFWFGLPASSKEISLNEGNYVLRKDLHAYRDSVNNYKSDLSELETVECEIESHIYLNIGDKVSFHGRTMFVWESRAILAKGLLSYRYKLMPAAGIRQNPLPNSKIKGSSLWGIIIDISESMVKVHLGIDKEQSSAEAYWFPYAAEGNNAIYAMPQKDFDVELYFPNTREKDAFVICSLPRGGQWKTYGVGEKHLLANYRNKQFSTVHGKQMELRKYKINFSSRKNDFKLTHDARKFSKEVLLRGSQFYNISMDTRHGIIVSSDLDINIKADFDIRLDTCKQMLVNAKNSLVLSCCESSIGFEKLLNLVSDCVKYEK